MKREHFFAELIALMLSVAIALAGIGCISTGFRFAVQSFPRIIAVLCLCVTVYLLLCHFRGGWLIYIALAALVLSYLLRHTELLLSIEALLYRITKYYDGGYGWGYIRWSTEPLEIVSPDSALTLAGSLIAVSVSHCIHKRTWLGVGLLAGLLPLFVCCVVTDTAPDAAWLWLLLTLLLILTLTHLVRRYSVADGNRLTALILIPAVLCSALLFRNSSEAVYQTQSQSLQSALYGLTEKLYQLFPAQGHGGGSISTGLTQIPTQVDLTDAGPMTFTNNTVMEVTTSRSGIFYLRGRAYDTYTGTGWEVTADTTGEGGWPDGGMAYADTVTIRTHFSADLQYFPYYIRSDSWADGMVEGALHNPDYQQKYSFPMMVRTSMLKPTFVPLTAEEKRLYCELPADTLAAAQQILDKILISNELTSVQLVEVIGNYVKNTAKYDLNTNKMPADKTDFAIWFLEEGETGYCTHFATAATVLLRAAGVPARYVTGYRTTVTDGTSDVTVDESHAWVEYLHPYYGWTVMDPTPASTEAPPIILPTTPPTQTTAPTETTVPTQTTVPPTETTVPTETTAPTETTEPSLETAAPTESISPTETTAPTEPSQTVPSGNGQGGTAGPQWNLEWIRTLLWILAAWAILFGQDKLRKYLRRRKMTAGDPNRQAAVRWRYAKRLSRLSGCSAADLLPLAEKAAFSQHTLTAEELARFDAWFQKAKQQLKQKPWPLRVLIYLVFAIE